MMILRMRSKRDTVVSFTGLNFDLNMNGIDPGFREARMDR